MGLQARPLVHRSGGKCHERAGTGSSPPGQESEISRKHGNTLVRTLRKLYGAGFAPGCSDEEKLSDVLDKFDEASLSQLHRDHDGRQLEGKIKSLS
jgi:hypothetical protein